MAPEPCAYLRFDTDDFSPPTPKHKAPELVQQVSATGDPCHYNVHHISNSRLEKRLRNTDALPMMRLCSEAGCEPFTAERAIWLYNLHYPNPK